MRKLAALLILCSSFAVAETPWLNGKLLSFQQDQRSRLVDGTSYSNLVYDVEIDTGDKVLYGEDVLRFRWNKAPQLTENAPLQYRLAGRNIEFQDESGRTYKVKLVKQRAKNTN